MKKHKDKCRKMQENAEMRITQAENTQKSAEARRNRKTNAGNGRKNAEMCRIQVESTQESAETYR